VRELKNDTHGGCWNTSGRLGRRRFAPGVPRVSHILSECSPKMGLTKTKFRSSVDAPMLTAKRRRSRFSHDIEVEGSGKFAPGEDILVSGYCGRSSSREVWDSVSSQVTEATRLV
jgi:hypothetical protein